MYRIAQELDEEAERRPSLSDTALRLSLRYAERIHKPREEAKDQSLVGEHVTPEVPVLWPCMDVSPTSKDGSPRSCRTAGPRRNSALAMDVDLSAAMEQAWTQHVAKVAESPTARGVTESRAQSRPSSGRSARSSRC